MICLYGGFRSLWRVYMDGQDGSGCFSGRLGFGRRVNSMRFCYEKGACKGTGLTGSTGEGT